MAVDEDNFFDPNALIIPLEDQDKEQGLTAGPLSYKEV